MKLSELKSLFLKTLIGCLIAAAGLAVVTVLVGKFNGVLGKALFTILLVAIHSLLSLAFIENNEKQDTFQNLEFFTNTTFGIIVLSFMTSVLGTWNVLPGEAVGRAYELYIVLLFATLHGEVLAKTMGKQSNIDKVVTANFFFMISVVLMLLPIIVSGNASQFGGFYVRLLAALGIVDATLTLVAVILHTLYVQRHPKVQDPVFAIPQMLGQAAVGSAPGQFTQPVLVQQQPKRHTNLFVKILIGFAVLQLLGGLFFAAVGLAFR